MTERVDVLVVGGGPAGLVAAWQAARTGARTRLITAGWGTLYWHAGCIDVLGYQPLDAPEPLPSPGDGLARLVSERPDHPYALLGREAVDEAIRAVAGLCATAGYPLHGSLDENLLLPTAVGGVRPTCLAPFSMTAGDLRDRRPAVIVGFEGFQDFYADLVADNLVGAGVPARSVVLRLREVEGRRFVNSTVLAGLFDDPGFRERVAEELGPRVGRAARVGFPAVLGLKDAASAVTDLRHRLGVDVFEIPTLPPSVPGIRLNRILMGAVESAGGEVMVGSEAVAADRDPADPLRVDTVWTEAAARRRAHRAAAFVLATGGILGGGIVGEADGTLHEVVMGMPVAGPRSDWLEADFFDPEGHRVYRAGIPVDGELHPLGVDGNPAAGNVWVAGGMLGGAEVIRERSLEGIAVTSGFLAGRRAAASLTGREAPR